MPPHLDKPEGHLAQGSSVLPWKELLLSKAMCLPPPKPYMSCQLLSPAKTKPSPGTLSGSLGRGLCICPAGVCSVQSLITPGSPGVGALHPILSLILPLPAFSASGVQVLNPSLFRVKRCWVLAPMGWAPCLSGEGVHRGFWQSSPWACFEMIHPSREFIISCLWSSPCT